METRPAIVLVAVGDNFESANAAVMYEARNAVRAQESKQPKAWLEEANAILNDVKPEWMENWYDGLGFCKLKYCLEYRGQWFIRLM